ncbi:hypothetical protein, partial [Pseudomonas amygdali]|uniref:hypothetical protein n=1 Tax=Pseudomonas amygdali TaxID=47877 RepID=UPI001C0FC1E9
MDRDLLKAMLTGNLRHAERRFELCGLLQPDIITGSMETVRNFVFGHNMLLEVHVCRPKRS